MKKFYFSKLPLLIVATTFLNAEPSAFGAGDINSDNPYGLTQNEKQLLEVKRKVDNVDIQTKTINNQISIINDNVDGMRSIFDGLNLKIQSLEQSIKHLNENGNETINNIVAEIQELKNFVEKSREIETANNENIKKTLNELTTNIDKNYVVKTSFNSLEARVLALEGKKQTPTTNTSNFSKMDSAEVLKKGEELFSDKKYSEAKAYFEYLLSKNYRPARSSFVLGEIEYFETNYSKAIPHYKKSAELYSDASWMPKLIYHTAISFDKINDKENANQFYRALKTSYPNSEEAKVSPNR
jgi:TolA-binding protein